MTCRIVSTSNDRQLSHLPETDFTETGFARVILRKRFSARNLLTVRGNYMYHSDQLLNLALPSLEIILSAFLAISLTATIISNKARAPYTVILVLFGVAIAGSSLSSILGVSLLYDSLVGGGLFVGLVLPPLLFETTMNIRFEEFRAVARPALRLATVGVVIATVVGGLFLWQIVQLPLLPSFLFASIIAPTDTATVLEIFRRARLPKKLSTLMETEAVFNDATGITIFT